MYSALFSVLCRVSVRKINSHESPGICGEAGVRELFGARARASPASTDVPRNSQHTLIIRQNFTSAFNMNCYCYWIQRQVAGYASLAAGTGISGRIFSSIYIIDDVAYLYLNICLTCISFHIINNM